MIFPTLRSSSSAVVTFAAVVYATAYLALRRICQALVGLGTRAVQAAAPNLSPSAALAIAVGLEVLILFRPSPAVDGFSSVFAIAQTSATAMLLLVCAGSARVSLKTPLRLSDLAMPTSWPERSVANALSRRSDAIFTRLTLFHSVLLIPVFVGVASAALISSVSVALYFLVISACGETFELVDHTNLHNRVFTPRLGARPHMRFALRGLEWWHDNIASVMIGRIPRLYRTQHLFVHHVEDNGAADPQSTSAYDRTSYFDFSRYAFRMALNLVVPAEIAVYLIRRGRTRPVRSLGVGILMYAGVLIGLSLWNPMAAVVLMALRFSAGVGVALLNFFEHGLVDPSEPANIYRSASTVALKGPEAHGALGSDLHIAHHLHPSRHWTQLIDDARASSETYEAEGTIVYGNATRLTRYMLLRQFDRIAAECIDRPNAVTPAELERRARPLRPRKERAEVRALDRALSTAVARTLV